VTVDDQAMLLLLLISRYLRTLQTFTETCASVSKCKKRRLV